MAAALLAGCGGSGSAHPKPPPDVTARIEAAFDEPLPPQLVPGSPVRFSGIAVGTVTKVHRSAGESVVEMRVRIRDAGPQTHPWPLHTDATIIVRPRIFKEGRFFVDMQPGTPSAPPLKDGGRIPATQTRYKPTF
jgi:ABC-type transporter Mla subunit MlaD